MRSLVTEQRAYARVNGIITAAFSRLPPGADLNMGNMAIHLSTADQPPILLIVKTKNMDARIIFALHAVAAAQRALVT